MRLRLMCGTLIDLYDIPSRVITIGHVAKALGQINRYAGQTVFPYSVALHSVLVSYLVPRQHAYAGLLHDATEAFGLGDIPAPVKDACPELRALEAVVRERIAPVLGFPLNEPREVDVCDKGLARELEQHFLQGQPRPECSDAVYQVAREYLHRGRSAFEAEAVFLRRHEELRAD